MHVCANIPLFLSIDVSWYFGSDMPTSNRFFDISILFPSEVFNQKQKGIIVSWEVHNCFAWPKI